MHSYCLLFTVTRTIVADVEVDHMIQDLLSSLIRLIYSGNYSLQYLLFWGVVFIYALQNYLNIVSVCNILIYIEKNVCWHIIYFMEGTGIHITIGGEGYKLMMIRQTLLNQYVMQTNYVFCSHFLCFWQKIVFCYGFLLGLLLCVWRWWSQSRNWRREMEVGNNWGLNSVVRCICFIFLGFFFFFFWVAFSTLLLC